MKVYCGLCKEEMKPKGIVRATDGGLRMWFFCGAQPHGPRSVYVDPEADATAIYQFDERHGGAKFQVLYAPLAQDEKRSSARADGRFKQAEDVAHGMARREDIGNSSTGGSSGGELSGGTNPRNRD